MHRLVLFDIDCTLVDARGAGGRAIFAAILDVYGVTGELDGYDFHGRTDPGIICDLVRMWSGDGAGVIKDPHARPVMDEVVGEMDFGTQPEAVALLARELGACPDTVARLLPQCLERYVEFLHEELSRVEVHVLPGIRELVESLSRRPGVVLGLLTGNIAEGAAAKLARTGLAHNFTVAAYGSDSPYRPDLPAVAVARAEEMSGRLYQGKEIVIIGDTPSDISCGADLGVRTIAVATGRHSVEELAAHEPDAVFPDFSDWRRAEAAILAERPGRTAPSLTES
jgi:phosphoglycolate phosphatase